jgi:hypothetical protein
MHPECGTCREMTRSRTGRYGPGLEGAMQSTYSLIISSPSTGPLRSNWVWSRARFGTLVLMHRDGTLGAKLTYKVAPSFSVTWPFDSRMVAVTRKGDLWIRIEVVLLSWQVSPTHLGHFKRSNNLSQDQLATFGHHASCGAYQPFHHAFRTTTADI